MEISCNPLKKITSTFINLLYATGITGNIKVNTANGSGSAFYLKQYDVFISNYHVVQGAQTLSIENKTLDRYVGKVVMVDVNEDIAIVKADGDFSALPEVGLSTLADILTRDEVFVLGYSYGMPYT